MWYELSLLLGYPCYIRLCLEVIQVHSIPIVVAIITPLGVLGRCINVNNIPTGQKRLLLLLTDWGDAATCTAVHGVEGGGVRGGRYAIGTPSLPLLLVLLMLIVVGTP